ncbi:MAG: GEVED domain-containing protein, partial [Saprospiraceae bacterium]
MFSSKSKLRRFFFFVVSLSLVTFLSSWIFFQFHDLNSSIPKLLTNTDTLSCCEQDKIESTKHAWGDLLSSHPYYNRSVRSKKEWNKIPSQDRPDLAFELDFLKTMDPATGEVPYERLYNANLELEKLIKKRVAIPGVSWTERGPNNVGGRTRCIMFDPNDITFKKVWAGGVGGGLWYTNDITVVSPVWNKVNDFWSNIAITTMAYNPNNKQELYVGTGEGWFNVDAQEGSGIWKSSNGGATWTNLPATLPGAYNSNSNFHYIQKIAIKNNGFIFAATRGYFINAGGIMRSIDGGTTWTKVLNVYTGAPSLYDRASDVEIAANGDLYAAFGIGSAGKIFKSLNAVDGALGTWTDLSTLVGIANGQRIELACAPSNANVIYAVAAGGSGSNDVEWLKRSINGGTTWTAIAIPRNVDDGVTYFTNGQAWYNLILAVHPTNSDYVIAGGLDLHRTINGGTSWSGISQWYGGFSQPFVHADQHAIVFRPGATNEVTFGNDGGLFYSANAGNSAATPSFAVKNTGYNVTQFYACATKNEFNSNYFLAGAQDNGTQKFTLPLAGNTTQATSGDGGFCHIDQLNSTFQITSYIYNNLYRSINAGGTFSSIISQNTGFFINPSEYDSNRKILYASSNSDLIKRVTGINGTITNTDISISVGVSKISSLKVSPFNDVVFLGIANGRIYKYTNPSTASPILTRIDNGATPISNTGWVSSIDVGEDDNHLLVTYSNYGVISVWQTTDAGAHWYNKEGNLPDIPIRWAIYNPDDREQVIAATEIGVWTTGNFGHTSSAAPVWGIGNVGPANTRCDMLKYRPADKMVVVATHGRGLFTSDIFITTSIADFTVDVSTSCSGALTVHFMDTSLKPNGSWAWDIDNNGSIDYTIQNPTHTYTSPGIYSVKLTINIGAATITKENLIIVLSSAPVTNTGCTFSPNSNSGNNFGIGIFRFAIGNIDYTTPNNDGYYQNYTCTQATVLDQNTSYNVTVQTGTFNNEGARLYIDYNNNGIFESGEGVVSFPSNMDGTRTLSFTTPNAGIVKNKGLRSRIISKYSGIPTTACDVSTYGQAEDYTVYFSCSLIVTQTSGTAAGSLPAAIACANSGDTIRISSLLAGQTLNIGSSTIILNK